MSEPVCETAQDTSSQLVSTYIDVDIFNGEKSCRWLELWLEAVKLPSAVEPLDGIKTVAVFQIVAAVQDDVRAAGDGLRRALKSPHHQSVAGTFQVFQSLIDQLSYPSRILTGILTCPAEENGQQPIE